MRKFIILGITLLVTFMIVLFGVGYWLISKSKENVVDTNSVAIEQVHVTNNQVEIKGSLTGSGDAYGGYGYSNFNGTLTVKIHHALFTERNSSGDFDIDINNNIGAKKIILQGKKTTDKVVLWSNK